MLNLEHLLEEAENSRLPIQKKRGVLREYLQVIALNSIYKHNLGKSMFFTGGTAMRFFYNMPRFSEDLDFDTPGLSPNDFTNILNHVKEGLGREGFFVKISSEKRKNLYIAELYFKDLMKLYGITDRRGLDLMIKIEIYKPAWGVRSESGVLSLYGYNFSCVLLQKGRLFSEKLAALFNRKRGRDIYDTLFMLKKKFPFDKDVLAANKIKYPPGASILRYFSSLSQKELKFLSNQIKPFLFKEDDVELILKAPLYAEKFLKEFK